MELDDEVCLCFHVSKRKVINFVRTENLIAASQLSQCYGAGTGCGWCRDYLEAIYQQATLDAPPAPSQNGSDSVGSTEKQSAEEYATLRQNYLKNRGRNPPPRSS